jgi:hypothetical protein
LFDDRIPYTRQNRAICLAIKWTGSVEALGFAMDRIAEWSPTGSDPGVCIAAARSVGQAVMAWGQAATCQVLMMDDAIGIAARAGLRLSALGGTGGGIIGALASVGLRAGGNNGRFVDLPGLRQLGEMVSQQDLDRLGIEIQHVSAQENRKDYHCHILAGARYKTLDWVRPQLIEGKAVWLVQWSDEHDAWISVDRKKVRHAD